MQGFYISRKEHKPSIVFNLLIAQLCRDCHLGAEGSGGNDPYGGRIKRDGSGILRREVYLH